MGRSYSAEDTNTLVAAGNTALSYQSTTAIRPALFELLTGNLGTPADAAIDCLLKRFDTADGTGDSPGSDALDPGDPAAAGVVQGNHSVEPTYGSLANPLHFGLNMRATFRWIAAPGKEIKAPAIATEGWGFQSIHASQTTEFTCTLMWEE